MSGKPLDELYLEWLYKQVADPEQDLTFWKVLTVLFSTEFVWVVPNDENRIADGKALREDFLRKERIRLRQRDRHWIELGCSMLELIVGLAGRLETEADRGKAHYWFWVLMENIGLSEEHFNDDCDFTEEEVEDVLEMVIQRYYEPDGRGGFFPLRNPIGDQREIELWYQLNEYVLEQSQAG
ncbi:hypothetical protein SEA_KARDASHIAN_57 [Streptomyces phage Kardashian]|nr:hypothetical protein SEA_KARDASHIAN_57 [Streptomyces phage Kardashian]